MDRRELINGFIRENIGLITPTPFPAALYKAKKHEYFLKLHVDSGQGLPRDTEIATEVVWFLIRRGQVKRKEDLDLFLSKGLLAEKVFDSQVYYEFLQINKPSEPMIDFKKIRETEFVESIREQIRSELRKEMTIDRVSNIEQEIQKKLAEYESLPFVIDAKEFDEPIQVPIESDSETYEPWWQQLHLKADPFPMTEGLRRIDSSSYESVVVKTPVFQRYLSFLERSPDEIFKNTIFFGEFGSGKTTLFEYLKKALSAYKIYSIYVQLYSEKDLQSLKITFKEKMIEELHDILRENETDPSYIESQNVDITLRALLNRLHEKFSPRGLVIFVDDLHKNREDYPVSLEFLSYLQIFTNEIVRRIAFDNVAFFIAGALEWEPIIRTQPRYSGSLARRETIPDITEEEAWTMLNKRLDAFYPNPEVKRIVDKEFVSSVYRDLKSNKLELTFRNFIQRLVEEFKIGNFKVLTSDPVHIPPDVLQKVKSILEENLVLKERFRTLLDEKLRTNENKNACLRLLLDIHLKKNVKENDLESERLYYLQQLAQTRLVAKARDSKGDFSWVACQELLERSKVISAEFSLSLEDYLLKIYAITPARRKRANEEIQQISQFIEKCEEDSRPLLRQVLALHTEIIQVQETYQLTNTEYELVKKCKESLEILTKFFIERVEKPDEGNSLEPGLRFWKNFWFSPGEVAQFENLISDEEECKRRIWYVFSIYRQAFNTLFSFVVKEHQSLNSIHISSAGLNNEDTKQLTAARDLWTSGNIDRAALTLYNFTLPKMRGFVQNSLTIVYGDLPNRLKYVNEKARVQIQEMTSSRTVTPGVPFHETNFLTLDELTDVITDCNGTADSVCWKHVFSKLFEPLTMTDISRYSKKLTQLADRSGREEATSTDKSLELRDAIISTVGIARKMNAAYTEFLTKSLHLEIEDGVSKLYISVDGLRDKSQLVGIQFRPDVLQSISGSLSSGPIRPDDQNLIQEYYSVPYREFIAYLALILSDESAGALKISTRYQPEKTMGSTVYLKKIFRFSMEKPPRVFLAHSSKDKTFCRTLADDLVKSGVTVWFDEYEIRVGDSITQKISDAIGENDYLGIVLSPDAVESEWVKKELSAGLIRELDKKAVVILPLLYRQCQIPPLIADKRYANFTKSYEKGLEELLNRFV